jgi:hypothetical protein
MVLIACLGSVGCLNPNSPSCAAVEPVERLVAVKEPTAPTAPAPVPTAPVQDAIILADGSPYTGPLHHNIPAIMPDNMSAGWMCETKPRRYILANGVVEYTLDHYIILGRGGCPDIPID